METFREVIFWRRRDVEACCGKSRNSLSPRPSFFNSLLVTILRRRQRFEDHSYYGAR